MSRADDSRLGSAEKLVSPTACEIHSIAVQLIQFPDI
jgi:hypothetical protein